MASRHYTPPPPRHNTPTTTQQSPSSFGDGRPPTKKRYKTARRPTVFVEVPALLGTSTILSLIEHLRKSGRVISFELLSLAALVDELIRSEERKNFLSFSFLPQGAAYLHKHRPYRINQTSKNNHHHHYPTKASFPLRLLTEQLCFGLLFFNNTRCDF